MGDLYVFDVEIIDGEEVLGFYYQNKSNNWNGVFVEFSEEQKKQAEEWNEKLNRLHNEQEELIKGWLSVGVEVEE